MKPRKLKYSGLNFIFSNFWRLKNPSKSLDFRISKFAFLVFGEIKKKARLGAVVGTTRQPRQQ
jgi:hypothetical protein